MGKISGMQRGRSRRVCNRASAVALALAMAACSGGGGGEPPGTPPPNVPTKYEATYRELQASLTDYINTVDAEWDGTNRDVHFAAVLLPAHASVGPGLLATGYYENVVLPYLDRLVVLGADTIAIEINYPLLTPRYIGDPEPYRAFYQKLADAVHARGLKLLVEHNVLLSGFSNPDPAPYYANLSRNDFGRERYQEVLSIVSTIKPDYLSLVTEPETYSAGMDPDNNNGLSFTAKEWRDWYLQPTVDRLAIDVPDHTTELGAGCGTWEVQQPYVDQFARVTNLNYIDLHVFPPGRGGVFLNNLRTWPDVVRNIDPDKKLVMSEAWLYKTSVSELGGAPISANFLARDVWSFWAPLDQLFLDALARTAYDKNYTVITPFWSRYYLAYLDYDDPSLAGLSDVELMMRANNAAYAALGAGTFTGTGDAFHRLATRPLTKSRPTQP